MSEQSGPVYEVTLEIDRAVADDVDAWLAGHVEVMLAVPGIVEARTISSVTS